MFRQPLTASFGKPGSIALALALLLGACNTINTGSLGPHMVTTPETASEANIHSLTAVIESNPRDPSAYNVRGSAYAQAGRYKEALRDFNAAIEIDPSFSAAYSNRALLYRSRGKTAQALQDYNRAIQANPSYHPALCRARQHLSPGWSERSGTGRLQCCDQSQSERRAGLSQPGADLPGAWSTSTGHRGTSRVRLVFRRT